MPRTRRISRPGGRISTFAGMVPAKEETKGSPVRTVKNHEPAPPGGFPTSAVMTVTNDSPRELRVLTTDAVLPAQGRLGLSGIKSLCWSVESVADYCAQLTQAVYFPPQLDRFQMRGGTDMSDTYEVTLAPAAARMIRSLPDPEKLAYSLSIEFVGGPNADKELRFDGNAQVCMGPVVSCGAIYTATPLSFDGYTALYRPMTRKELRRLERERGRLVTCRGFYVLDILPAESAFIRRPRPL